MSGFLDDREHAAENLFAHNEELLFLARRAGVRELALWVAREMGLEASKTDTYAVTLIDSFVSGVGDKAILTLVRTDLDAAGKAAASAQAAALFSRAVALASDDLSGRVAPKSAERHGAPVARTHPIGASLSWRD